MRKTGGKASTTARVHSTKFRLSLGIVAAATAILVVLTVLHAGELFALAANIDQRRFPPGMTAALLGAAGGIAKYLERYLEGQAFVILDALAIACISGFCGVIVFDGMIALGFAQDAAKVAGGLSGYYGPRSLDVLSKVLAKSAKSGSRQSAVGSRQ